MLGAFTGVFVFYLAKDDAGSGVELIGILFAFINAATKAIVIVFSRKMKEIHFSVVLFQLSSFSFMALSFLRLGQTLLSDTEPIMLFKYDLD